MYRVLTLGLTIIEQAAGQVQQSRVLTLPQLAEIQSALRLPAHLEHPFFSPVFLHARVPPTMAWLAHGGMEEHLRQKHASSPKTLVELFYFRGGQPVTEAFECQAGVACTIVAEWDGGWHSHLATKELKHRGGDTEPFKVWFHDGRMVVNHSFLGPSVRSLVFNEALLATGQILTRHCGFWNWPCNRANLTRFVRLNPLYPVGLMGFREVPLALVG